MMAFLGFVSLNPASDRRAMAVSWKEFRGVFGVFAIKREYQRLKYGFFSL